MLIPTLEAIENALKQHAVKGFLPSLEAAALFKYALQQAQFGPLLEVGSYCGKSAVYLGHAAKAYQQVCFTVDHHRGSEEHQLGEQYHDPELFNSEAQRFDTLPALMRTLRLCEVEEVVIPVVARSEMLAGVWTTPLAFIFIDGGHSEAQAKADCLGWAKHLMSNGIMAIHDIFERPEDGGQAPFLAMQAVMAAYDLELFARQDSLVFLRHK